MKPALGRFLVGCWFLICAMILAGVLYPKGLTLIPHREFVGLFLLMILVSSAIYGISSLYREGIKRSRKLR